VGVTEVFDERHRSSAFDEKLDEDMITSPDPCNESMAGLLASAVWAGGKRVCSFGILASVWHHRRATIGKKITAA
jgi:hypothetical protein